jgi:hypothetical protein
VDSIVEEDRIRSPSNDENEKKKQNGGHDRWTPGAMFSRLGPFLDLCCLLLACLLLLCEKKLTAGKQKAKISMISSKNDNGGILAFSKLIYILIPTFLIEYSVPRPCLVLAHKKFIVSVGIPIARLVTPRHRWNCWSAAGASKPATVENGVSGRIGRHINPNAGPSS